jgi:hypothetical protein
VDKFSKNIPISNFKKILPMGAELFHADGQIDGQIDGQELFHVDGQIDGQT